MPPEQSYAAARALHETRVREGWRPLGRKIGFTNRTLWKKYGVDRPMWAPIYAHTVHEVSGPCAQIALGQFVQPRIEPEVVFGLMGPVPVTGSARDVLGAVEWIAAGFEVVQSHFPGWKFTAADCTAAFGLHACQVVGARVRLDDASRDRLAAILPRFEVGLHRGSEMVDRGLGSNVLDSPALALQHLAQVLTRQPQAPPLAGGEIITTGTLTDAWPVVPGSSWRSDYGNLGVPGLELHFT